MAWLHAGEYMDEMENIEVEMAAYVHVAHRISRTLYSRGTLNTMYMYS